MSPSGRLPRIAFAVTLACACSGDAWREVLGRGQRPDLILISIDTLRADRLGCYGYRRPTSPTLDALAARGVRFDAVIAESSWTLPSHVSLFTGHSPLLHGVTRPQQKIPSDVPVLTEILKTRGYRTLGFTGGSFLAARFGFDRGFDFFADQSLYFANALDLAVEKIRGLGPNERFFTFLHTYDVHCPYAPPPRYAAAFQTHPPDVQLETRGRCGNPHYNSMDLKPGHVRYLSDRYDASIRYADDLLGRFLERLDESGHLENAIVVVLSDHGEEFREHGLIGHKDALYIESLRVPWIMAGPELEAQIVSQPVGLADVMPTLLALLDLPAPETEGESLVPVIRGRAPERRERGVVSSNVWGVRLRSVVFGDHHLIESRDSEETLLFAWRADPRERHNLARKSPERATRLSDWLHAHLEERAATRPRVPTETAPEPTAEQHERLRALGYVE